MLHNTVLFYHIYLSIYIYKLYRCIVYPSLYISASKILWINQITDVWKPNVIYADRKGLANWNVIWNLYLSKHPKMLLFMPWAYDEGCSCSYLKWNNWLHDLLEIAICHIHKSRCHVNVECTMYSSILWQIPLYLVAFTAAPPLSLIRLRVY